MSSTTWNGSSSTDWATGANWSTGSVPTTGAHVVIPDTSSINNCVLDQTRTIGSLTIEANGTLVGGGNKLIIQSEGDASGGTEGFAVNNDGIISGNLDLEINTPATTTCDFNGTSGNFQNVKLNHASVDATFHTDTTFDGTLIIAAGTLKPQGGSTITVAGDTTVTGTFGVASGSGAHSFRSLKINSGGTHIATSGTTTILSEASSGFALLNEGTFTHNNGTVSIGDGTTAAETHIKITTLYNLIINSNADSKLVIFRPESGSTVTIANDLTLTRGVFYRNNVSDTLTVTGDVSVASGSTLGRTNDNGASNFGSLRVVSGGTYIATSGTTTVSKEADTGGTDFMFHNDGTFTHNNGKFVFDDAGLSSNSNVRCSSSFYDVEITMGSFSLTSHHNMNAARDFTVTTGTYSDGSNGFTITRNVSVASGATLNLSNSSTQTKTMGFLIVASGGTIRACRGTTIVNGDPSGYPNFGIDIDGTFTHNNGTLKYTGGSGALDLSGTGNLYNFDHATTGTTFIVNNTTIENNLTMTLGNFQGANGNENLTVKGNVTIDSVGQTMSFVGTSEHTFGFLTILNGTYRVQNDTGGFTKVGGIRNVGGIVTNAV
jgi:hypothetical protein